VPHPIHQLAEISTRIRGKHVPGMAQIVKMNRRKPGRLEGWHPDPAPEIGVPQRPTPGAGEHEPVIAGREMRHTFVSVLSANGVPVGSIALLADHDRTATTESVYRHEIRPALTQGAEVMDKIFG